MINPAKVIITPRNKEIKDRNALVTIRKVPNIKQNIARMAMNVASSVSDASLIFFQYIAVFFIYKTKLSLCARVFQKTKVNR